MEKNNVFLFVFLCSLSMSLCEQNLETGHIQPRILEDSINSTIENIKASLPEVITIPLNISLEPSVNLTILNLNISGIKELLVPYLTINLNGFLEPIINFNFVLPVLEVDAGYLADFNLLDLMPIYGSGTARILISDLEIKGWAVASISPISLKELYLFINLQSVEVNIDGLLYDEAFSSFASSLITALANNLIVTYLNQNCVEIGNILSPIVRDALNSILAGNSSNAAELKGFESNNVQSEDVEKAFKIMEEKFLNFVKTL